MTAEIQLAHDFVDAGLMEYQRVAERARQVIARNPEVVTCQWDLVSLLQNKAWAELSAGRKAQAARTLAEIVDRVKLLESRQPRAGDAAYIRAASLARLAEIGGPRVAQTASTPADITAIPAEAVAALDRAIRQGYRKIRPLKADRDLNILRDRPDYQALVERLEKTLREEAVPAPKNQANTLTTTAATPAPANPPQSSENQSKGIADDRVELGDVYHVASVLFAYQENYDESRKYLDKALALREAIAGEHPENPWYRFRVIKSCAQPRRTVAPAGAARRCRPRAGLLPETYRTIAARTSPEPRARGARRPHALATRLSL